MSRNGRFRAQNCHRHQVSSKERVMGKKKKVFLAALIFMTFVFSMLVVAAWAKPRAKSAPVERIEVVRITVRTTGFEPKEIQYPNRPFLLAVDNQSGLEKLTLEMYREVG